jgi:phosphate transport system substrate-binding protein
MSQITRRPALAAGSLILIATMATGGAAIAQSPAASAPPMPPAPAGLTGSIDIQGSSTVEPITTKVREAFNVGSPGVAITVGGEGTGPGFAQFCNGETDISDASRAMKAEGEADVCAANGVEYIELKIALDGLSVITAATNDTVECLTFADLYALVGPEASPDSFDPDGPDGPATPRQGSFTNWKDAQELATALGSPTTFPDAPLNITGPGEESGTYDFFVEKVITPIALTRNNPDLLDETGKVSFTRLDYQSSKEDLPIVVAVGGTPDNNTTLGWVGYAFVEENLDLIKPLQVDGGKGCVAPTYDTISDGTYPISRPLFIYVNKAKAAEKPEVAAFVDYYLADKVIDTVLETVPYVNLSADEIAATRAAWAAH